MNIFWRHVSSVFFGTLLAQSIPIIGSLFIARIFAPSEFGEFSTWLAIVSFSSVVITLRFEAVLVIVEDGIDRAKSVFIISVTTMLMAVVFFIVFVFFNYLTGGRYFSQVSSITLMVITPAALLLALNQIWQAWAASEGLYTKLNIMRLVQTMILVVVQIGLGMKSPTAISLVMGFIVASGIAFAWSFTVMPKIIYREFFYLKDFRKFFYRYKNFPLYALPADSINTAVGQLPILVISHRFGNDAAGYLALTMRVLGAPIGLVGKAVLDVFKRHAIQSIKETGNCKDLYINTFFALSLASLSMIAGTILFGEDIFRIAFGREWIFSGQMAIWLLPMFAMRLIASPLSYMAYLVEKQRIDLFWQLALAIASVVSLYIFPSHEMTLIGYSIGYALMYVVYIFLSYQLSKGQM